MILEKNFYKKLIILNIFLCSLFNYINADIQFAQANSIAIDSNSNLIALGLITDENNNTTINIARYTPTGALDITFNSPNGITSLSAGAPSVGQVVVDNSGNITIAAGGTNSSPEEQIIAQYTSSGTLNNSFGTGGVITQLIDDASIANSLVIQPDGKIVVSGIAILSGQIEAVVSRYTSTGSLDSSFGTSGIVRSIIGSQPETHAVTLDQNNNIVTCGITNMLSGTQFLVIRYTPTGDLDTTFNSVGYITFDVGSSPSCTSLVIDSNNNIVVAGQAGNHICLARLLPDGTLDTSFGPSANGIVITTIDTIDIAQAVTIQADGKIVIAGSSNDFIVLVRYNTDGSLDTSFGSSGIVSTPIGQFSSAQSILIQPNGQIVIAGYNDTSFILVRYNGTDGSLDSSFGNSGIVNAPGAVSGPLGLVDGNIADNAGIKYSKLDLNGSIVNGDISISASITDNKLATIQTPGTVANSATTATSSNTPNTIVARDGLGNITVTKVIGNVVGYATSDVNRYGDSIPGAIAFPPSSATGPGILFSNSSVAGFFSPAANVISVTTNGLERTQVTSSGGFVINNPDSGNALTINGGGASITGDVTTTDNITYNTASTTLNAIGSTLSGLKVYAGSDNTGLSGSVTINFSAAGFTATPGVFINPTSGSSDTLSISSITTTAATISSNPLNVAFNYFAIGT